MNEFMDVIPCDSCSAIKNEYMFRRCGELGACWISNGKHPLDEVLEYLQMSYFEFNELINPFTTVFEIKDENGNECFRPCKQYGPVKPIVEIIFEMVENIISDRRKIRLRRLGGIG